MKRRQFLRDTAGLLSAAIPGMVIAQSLPCPPPSLQIAKGATSTTACPPPKQLPTPAGGTFANLSLDTMASVDPCPGGSCTYFEENGQEGVFVLWNGCAWAPNYSQQGAVLFHGGGHQGYGGNEAYAFDLTTQKWVRHKTPSPYNESDVNGDGEYPDGQPFPPHMYMGLAYLPPPYGGSRGALIRMGFAGDGAAVQHMYKMVLSDTPDNDKWERWGPAPLTQTNSYNFNAWDSNRNAFWVLGGGECDGLVRIDTSGNISVIANSGTNVDSQMGFAYSPTLDFLVVIATAASNPYVWGRYPSAASGTYFAKLTTTGTPPPDINRNGLAWSNTLGCFVQYPGNGSYSVYMLTPPKGASPNLLGGTWTWTTQTLTGVNGATPIVAKYPSGYNGNWGRFIEVPALRAFLYADGRDNPVQLWRLNGMS